jgi:hypothetical protein
VRTWIRRRACSALFGVVAEVEALGLELLELRQILPKPREGD